MKALSYHISTNAISDLEDIWTYTERNWSETQAERYYNLIIDEIKYLCRYPEMGKLMPHRKGYRTSKVKSHIIFYRIVNETLQITRILHEQMDVGNHLME